MFGASVLLSLLLTSGSYAHQQAVTLAEIARREYQATDYARALRDFQAAYTAEPLAPILFNIAQCLRKLERWQPAADAYRRYLSEQAGASNRAEVLGYIAEVEAKGAAATTRPAAPSTNPPLVLSLAPTPDPRPAPNESVVTLSSETPSEARGKGVLPWLCFGGAAIAAGLAITGAVEVASYNSAEARVRQAGNSVPASELNTPRAQNWGTAALVLAPIAVVAAAAGVTFLVW